jgi:AcrR family transcriptional regulator
MRLMIQAEAFRLFAKQGYSETTVEQIADAAAISPRTFFRYFPTKEDVVLWDEYDPLVLELFLSRPKRETAFQSMRAVITTALHGLYERNPELLLTRIRLFATVPELRPRFLDLQAQGADEVARLFAEHRGMKSDDDELELRILSGAIQAAVNVALQRWEAASGKGDPSVFVEEALDALVSSTSGRRRARTP